MKRTLAVLGAAAILVAVALPALAQGPGPRPMRGYGPRLLAQPAGPALSLEQAAERVRQYLGAFRNPDLAPVEVIEFSNVFYVVVQEKSTGKPGLALLVNRSNGNVFPEMGPPMMWNTKYGRATAGFQGHGMGMGPGHGPGAMGPGMMGPGMMGSGYGPGAIGPGMGPSMMGPGYGPQPGAQPSPGAAGARPAVPQLDEAKARAALQAWVNQAFPGAGIGKALEFSGFFTYRLTRDGKTFALASVNAYGGQVWYAWQYGTVVKEQVIR
ncbi:MAG: hypothetical protein HY355_04975 [Armatimonadetes bacterium]|nr:hypothetical protein [Armatimonadota bacterium]